MEENTTDTTTHKFLCEIFEPNGEPLESGQIAVWNKVTHQTRLANDPAEAAQFAAEPQWLNISYFGVCTRSRSALRRRASETGKPLHLLQGEKPELVAMPGLWVDIDIRAAGHKKESLAPTVDAALDALRVAVPLEPTVVVRTGGGIHAYWLFDEGVLPFAASGQSRSREDLESLVRSFQAMVRDELKKRGWADDQTWALPRVMRVPGQMNTSHGEPRKTSWEKTGPRHSVDALWAVVPEGLQLSEPTKVEHDDDRLRFEIGPIDEPAVRQFIEEVCDIDDDFARVWERRRKSLPSQSEMDLSIATRLAAGDTPTQVIVDALRMHRIAGGANPDKANRADYYLGVLQLAFGSSDEDRRRVKLLERVETMKAVAPPTVSDDETAALVPVGLTEDQRREVAIEALAVVNEAFELKDDKRITRITRETSSSGMREEWRFFFGNLSPVSVRSVRGATLMSCMALRTEVFLATGMNVKPFSLKPTKPRQWGPVVKAIFLAADTVGAENETDGLLNSLLRFVEAGLLQSPASPHPFTDPWHRMVERSAPLLFWKSKGGETGALVRLDAWVGNLQLDPIGPQMHAQQRASWARMLSHTCPSLEVVPAVSFVTEDGKRRNRTGYVRLRRAFFADQGSPSLAEQLDEAVANAPQE